MLDELKITKLEYIDIWKNRGKKVITELDEDAVLEKVKYLKKRDLIRLATIKGLVLNETSLENILDVLLRDIHKNKLKNLKDELYRNIQKRKNDQIINELKKIGRIKKSSFSQERKCISKRIKWS